MIKAILFDLDGVLVDACDWHYDAFNRALQEVSGVQIDTSEHLAVFNGLPTKVKLDILVNKGRIQDEHKEDISRLKQKFTKEVIDDKCHIDYRKQALLKLLRVNGFHLACVTNCIRSSAIHMLDRSGLLSQFNILISNEDIVHPKPHPEGYWKAMSTFGVTPEETLIVEDSIKGVQAAEATGANVWKVQNATEVTWDNLVRTMDSTYL